MILCDSEESESPTLSFGMDWFIRGLCLLGSYLEFAVQGVVVLHGEDLKLVANLLGEMRGDGTGCPLPFSRGDWRQASGRPN
jgi:hypothetical protein